MRQLLRRLRSELRKWVADWRERRRQRGGRGALRSLGRLALGLTVGLPLTVLLLSYPVGRAARGYLFSVTDSPARDLTIVFGAGVHADGTLTAALGDRVQTAAELYLMGKTKRLLMSGDNSREGYDEPTAMKEEAVRLGVRAEDIVLDYAGFHTYDTCYRARAIFGVDSALLVTQGYHLPRAIFTCRGLGIDAVGVAADRQHYQRYAWYLVREQGSRARAFLQVRLTKPPPHFLGPKVPLPK